MLMLILMLYNSNFSIVVISFYIDLVFVYYRVFKEEIIDLELSAVRAMFVVFCCGSVFDFNGLNDDGYIYKWVYMLFSFYEDRVGYIRLRLCEVK